MQNVTKILKGTEPLTGQEQRALCRSLAIAQGKVDIRVRNMAAGISSDPIKTQQEVVSLKAKIRTICDTLEARGTRVSTLGSRRSY